MSVDPVKQFLELRCLEKFYKSEGKSVIEEMLKVETIAMVKAKNDFFQIVDDRIYDTKTVEEAKAHYEARKKLMDVVSVIVAVALAVIFAAAFIAIPCCLPAAVVLSNLGGIIFATLFGCGMAGGIGFTFYMAIQTSGIPESLTKEQKASKKEKEKRLTELSEAYIKHAKVAQGLILNGCNEDGFDRLLNQKAKKQLTYKDKVSYIKPYMVEHLKLEGDQYPGRSMAVYTCVRKHLTETTPMELSKMPMTEYRYVED